MIGNLKEQKAGPEEAGDFLPYIGFLSLGAKHLWRGGYVFQF